MAGIFLATPGAVIPPAPPVPVVDLKGIRLLWHGWDGTSWDLTGATSGVRLLQGGLTGLKTPGNVQWYTAESPSVDGVDDRGWRLPARDVIWPVGVFASDGSQAWLDYDRAFWRTLQPGRFGTWECQQPSGVSRTLRLRLEDSGDPAFGQDPSVSEWATYGVRLKAPAPYWLGVPMSREWNSGTTQNFFGGPGVINISSSNTVSAAAITNPGDVEVAPKWTVFGPTTSADLGVNGRLIEAHFAVPSGKALVVDSDPRLETAYQYDIVGGIVDLSTGVERTGELGAADFAAIPVGDPVTLSLAMVGNGSVRAEITPAYFEAW